LDGGIGIPPYHLATSSWKTIGGDRCFAGAQHDGLNKLSEGLILMAGLESRPTTQNGTPLYISHAAVHWGEEC